MRLYPALIICCLQIPNLFPQEPQPPESAPRVPYVMREEKEFSFYPGGKVEISIGGGGSLKIVGWQRAIVRMEAEKIIYYPSKEQEPAEPPKIPIKVRYSQTSSTIKTPLNPESNAEVNLTIYVPSYKTDINAKLDHGDFSVEGVNGWVEVTVAVEGNIEAKSLSGYFSGTTPHGDVSVEMDGIRWKGLEFGALTQRGAVKLQIPEKFSAALQLETRDGKISVDYPPQVVEGEIVPPEIAIHKNSQQLKATVGDGGAPIKLVTFLGDVTLSKKE
jgi:hypothetical protein